MSAVDKAKNAAEKASGKAKEATGKLTSNEPLGAATTGGDLDPMVLAASSASTIGYSCDQTHSSCWSWASKRSAALPRTGWPAPGFSLTVTRVFFFFSNLSNSRRVREP